MPATKKTVQKKKKAESKGLEVPVYSMKGEKVASIALPETIFGAPWRSDLVHQVTTGMQANARQNRAHTKNRAEVAGGGKKPWAQKGTGQARHGSSRSPIWRHGGITFGPRSERDYGEKINRKMRVAALLSVLSRKAKDGELVLVDEFMFTEPKTKNALTALIAISKAADVQLLSKKGANSALIALAAHEPNIIRSFRNLQGVATEEARSINPLQVLTHKYLVIERPNLAFKLLAARAKK